MKRTTIGLAVIAVVLLAAGAAMAAATPAAMEDVKVHPSCPICGMDRQVYSHSRGLVEYEDGKAVGTCSIHCIVLDVSQNPGRKVKATRVADYDTRELLDPEAATWVVGGKKPGVMTPKGKWAFATRQAADAFLAANGGEIATYEAVLAATKAEQEARKKGSKKSKKAPAKKSAPSCCDNTKK